MTKKELKSMIAQAYEMQSQTKGTQVVFNVCADAHYVLDTDEDNIIECVETEEDAKRICNGETMKGSVYYKPMLIDADTGERITRKNFDRYKK